MKKRKTWRNKLTEAELRHLKEDALGPGVRVTLWRLERNFEHQAKMRREASGPVVEPCWTCRGIAKKLGFEV